MGDEPWYHWRPPCHRACSRNRRNDIQTPDYQIAPKTSLNSLKSFPKTYSRILWDHRFPFCIRCLQPASTAAPTHSAAVLSSCCRHWLSCSILVTCDPVAAVLVAPPMVLKLVMLRSHQSHLKGGVATPGAGLRPGHCGSNQQGASSTSCLKKGRLQPKPKFFIKPATAIIGWSLGIQLPISS